MQSISDAKEARALQKKQLAKAATLKRKQLQEERNAAPDKASKETQQIRRGQERKAKNAANTSTLVGAGAVEVVDLALDVSLHVAAAHEAPYQVSEGFASSYRDPAMSFQDLMHAPGYLALMITYSDHCRSCGWLY